ncbi:MAG: hypothetical protein CW694_00010 [Candidatus Syntrophoarchaeum sp. WYZ-LMO15]|nr:MAG: hypothetical protein CW694_00010 [Candidatus Syntrophoarchaeum sp. WYZ-LMO15]
MSKKITALLTVLLFPALAMFTVSAATPSISTPDCGMRGMTLPVTILSDGRPVQGADVYFVLNSGTPVHGQTDTDGRVNYKPLLTGRLNITAIYGGISTSKEIPIYEPAYGVNLTVVGDSRKTVAPGEDATYLLRVINTGNVTDTINLTIDGPGSLNTTSTSLRLEPGAGAGRYLLLTVSGLTTAGTYTTAITATSTSDSSVSESVSVTTVVSSGGGGYHGGGGGGPSPSTNIPVDPDTGDVTSTTTLSTDGAELIIPAGTIVKDATGNPLSSSITIIPLSSTAASFGAIAAFELAPGGTTFNPPIDLVISYDPADIPEGLSESDLVIRVWDGTGWSTLETSVDTTTHTATAKISHFSIFALFAKAQAASSPSATVTPTTQAPTPSPAGTPSSEPEKKIPWALVIISVIIILIIAGGVYYIYTRRR